MTEVSHKSEMAGPFNRGDTIINTHLNFSLYFILPFLTIVLYFIMFLIISAQNMNWGRMATV